MMNLKSFKKTRAMVTINVPLSTRTRDKTDPEIYSDLREIMLDVKRRCDVHDDVAYHIDGEWVCGECGSEWSDDGSECHETCVDGNRRAEKEKTTAHALDPDPACAYPLTMSKDGDQWCVLTGANLQDGTAGFGDTPKEAFHQFLGKLKRLEKSK